MTRRLTWPIVVGMSDVNTPDTKFNALLREQIRSEFTASQQYVAIAVYFDGADLPQLAAHFYAQAVEERNHAMMLVQYLLDRDIDVEIPGIDSVFSEAHLLTLLRDDSLQRFQLANVVSSPPRTQAELDQLVAAAGFQARERA